MGQTACWHPPYATPLKLPEGGELDMGPKFTPTNLSPILPYTGELKFCECFFLMSTMGLIQVLLKSMERLSPGVH